MQIISVYAHENIEYHNQNSVGRVKIGLEFGIFKRYFTWNSKGILCVLNDLCIVNYDCLNISQGHNLVRRAKIDQT